jgi:hypothetical protein
MQQILHAIQTNLVNGAYTAAVSDCKRMVNLFKNENYMINSLMGLQDSLLNTEIKGIQKTKTIIWDEIKV